MQSFNFIKNTITYLIMALVLISCSSTSVDNQPQSQGPNIIFETDMGNDVDDALALDMLYKYIEAGKINLLAISTNKEGENSPGYIDVMNTWYGHPDIPIGVITKDTLNMDNNPSFVKATCDLEIEGKPAFERTIKSYGDFPKSVPLYRRILASQPDASVTIISVGFSTNLIQLLDTKGDEFSPLTGKELVAKRVKLLSAMLGRFDEETTEYNVLCDIPAAQRLMQEWPTEIIISPFEVGEAILYPGSSIQNDFKWKEPNPLVVGYTNYLPMPYDRPTWDLTSVLQVVESDKGFFNISEKGVVNIDEKGVSRFSPAANGKHSYLMVTKAQADSVKNHFINLITLKPEKYK